MKNACIITNEELSKRYEAQINEMKAHICALKEENNVLRSVSEDDAEEIKGLKEECKQKDKKIKDLKFAIKTLAEDL